jgi:hypothetical protein
MELMSKLSHARESSQLSSRLSDFVSVWIEEMMAYHEKNESVLTQVQYHRASFPTKSCNP